MTYLSSNAILYAENTALFSTIHHVKTSATELNDNWSKINSLAFQRKISFNSHPSKQASEITFSTKNEENLSSLVTF